MFIANSSCLKKEEQVRNRIIAFVMIFALVTTSFAFGENTFSEIGDLQDPAIEWAEPFISKMLATDVMPTYSADEYRPTSNVTKMEVINVIYRMALLKGEVTTTEAANLVNKHKSTIDAYLIPNNLEPYGPDNHRAIAYALEREILKKSELSLFYVNGGFEVISKVDASVFIAKALNVYLKENVNKFYEIQYIDGGEINLIQWPWINLLIEQEVVVGGNDRNFYPNQILQRSILAVIASNTLGALNDYVPGQSTSQPQVSGDKSTLTGKISILHYDANIIEIRDEDDELSVFDSNDTKIILNGDFVNISKLEPGMSVTAKLEDNKLVELVINQELTSVKGTISSIGIKQNSAQGTFKPIGVEVNDGFKYFMALDSVVVEKDYTSSSLDKLNKNDIVEVFFQDSYAKKIVALSESTVLTGALERSSSFNKGDGISIRLSNGKLFEQTLKTEIDKFNVNSGLSKGDIVELTIQEGKIIAVEGTGLSTKASGRIVSFTVAANSKIKIIDKKGELREFDISSNVAVKNLGTLDDNKLYALRLDQDVELDLENMKVTLITISQSVEKNQFSAEIVELHKNINIIKAKDAVGKLWIISLEASDQNITDFEVGDDIYVHGVELSDDLFEASLIIEID